MYYVLLFSGRSPNQTTIVWCIYRLPITNFPCHNFKSLCTLERCLDFICRDVHRSPCLKRLRFWSTWQTRAKITDCFNHAPALCLCHVTFYPPLPDSLGASKPRLSLLEAHPIVREDQQLLPRGHTDLNKAEKNGSNKSAADMSMSVGNGVVLLTGHVPNRIGFFLEICSEWNCSDGLHKYLRNP